MHNFLGLGIGLGRFILILVCIYFVVKFAVKKGIAEYYEDNQKKTNNTSFNLASRFNKSVFFTIILTLF